MSVDVYDPSGLLIDTACPVDYSWGPNTGLVARYQSVPNPGWDGGVKLKDLCRRQIDATLTSMAFPPTSTSGWSRQTHRGGSGSIAFTGAGPYVNCGNTSAFNFTTTPFSISTWFRFQTVTANDVWLARGLFHGDGYYLGFNSTAGQLTFNTTTASALTQTISSVTFTVGQWYHAAYTFAGTTARIFINGKESAYSSQPTMQQPLTSTRNLYLGRYDSTGLEPPINLNDTRIWARALSAGEIRAIYLDSLAGSPSSLNWMVDDDYCVPSSSNPAGTTAVGVVPMLGCF